MANRAVDMLITYRVVKLLVTPWEKQEAFKQGIIDKKGTVLRPNKTLKTTKDKTVDDLYLNIIKQLDYYYNISIKHGIIAYNKFVIVIVLFEGISMMPPL